MESMTNRRASAVLALLLLSGCTSATTPPADRVTSEVTEPTAEVRSLVLPFDRYELSPQEFFLADGALDLLVLECMRERGFDWKVIKRPTGAQDLRNRRRYGVIEMNVATRYGYEAPPIPRDQDTARMKNERYDQLSRTEKVAAFGTKDSEGCMEMASRALYGDSHANYKRFTNYHREVHYGAKKRPPVSRALGSWSTCMELKGYDYKDPAEAIDDQGWRSKDGRRGTPREVALAVADVTCKQQSGLVKKWFSMEKELENLKIKNNSDYFRGLLKEKVKLMEKVRAIHAAA
ncbi:hypothetical protein ACIRQY_22515 [Streptomyces sp. NPDC101490]|uniref:hypothetical protein n=1 Tax=Streptomyces sp. NPDC101490 TaxID=3366143 RepID=UPI00382E76C9